ncbi:hypothetical protein ACKKBG_A29830 [Auxenochlorella protothecoides x Auxenochlorella symbiontica]
MIGLTEIAIVAVAGAVLFGPKELPGIARALGRQTGRAMAYVQAGRTHFFKFARENEVDKLHADLSATLNQLNAIRDELRGGLNIMKPGPMTRRLLQDQGLAPAPLSIGTLATPATPEGGSAGAQARPVASFSVRDPAAVPQPQAPASSWAASGAAPAQPAAMASLMQAGRTAGVHGPRIEGANAPSTARQTGLGTARGSPDQGPHPSQIPVSALEAGLVQDRTGTTPTGSDLMMDALLEEMVARQAQMFFKNQESRSMT